MVPWAAGELWALKTRNQYTLSWVTGVSPSRTPFPITCWYTGSKLCRTPCSHLQSPRITIWPTGWGFVKPAHLAITEPPPSQPSNTCSTHARLRSSTAHLMQHTLVSHACTHPRSSWMIDSLRGKLSKNTLKNASNSEVIVHHREFWNLASSQGASWPHRESSIMPLEEWI